MVLGQLIVPRIGVFFILLASLSCGEEPPSAPAAPAPSAPQQSAVKPPPQRGGPGHPPSNALQAGSLAEEALPQPDPGPAPEAPPPVTEGCPEGMAQAMGEAGAFCIQRYEAHVRLAGGKGGHPRSQLHNPSALELVSEAGLVPTPLTFNDSRMLCHAKGFRLCTSAEWRDACDGQPGDGGAAYSTLRGSTYAPGDCNFTHHMSGGMMPLAKSGSYPWCRTPTGVYDLMGNLWEWSDPGDKGVDGRHITDKRGGAHYARKVSSCAQTAVGTHGPNWMGSVGFRCCADLTE